MYIFHLRHIGLLFLLAFKVFSVDYGSKAGVGKILVIAYQQLVQCNLEKTLLQIEMKSCSNLLSSVDQ